MLGEMVTAGRPAAAGARPGRPLSALPCRSRELRWRAGVQPIADPRPTPWQAAWPQAGWRPG